MPDNSDTQYGGAGTSGSQLSGRMRLPSGRIEIPAEWQAILDQKLAPNGLYWLKMPCQQCGYHLGDNGILLGCYRKKCPNCKFPNVIEINRVGEEQIMRYLALGPLDPTAHERLVNKTESMED